MGCETPACVTGARAKKKELTRDWDWNRKVFVFDPTDLDGYVIPIGKQTKRPEHIFYRPCSGIWQTVWLESAPAERITQLDVKAAADGTTTVNVHASGNSSQPVEITVLDQDGSVLGTGSGTSGEAFEFTVDGVDPWSPDSPTLYNLTVTLGDDVVSSYTGFRTVGRGVIDGVQRPLLNGEWIFQWATLDQGFWPDGIHLAPNYEALIFDLQELKKLGFNAVRKHVSRKTPCACCELGDLRRSEAKVLTNPPKIRSKSSLTCFTMPPTLSA